MITPSSGSSESADISLIPSITFSIDLGRIYPNIEIKIFELGGRMIQKENVYNCRTIGMQISGSPGIYLININSGNESSVLKILEE